jgi:hypothetical protein
MIASWTSYVARQERYQDLLRQAEKQRVIRKATGGRTQSALWQAIQAWALGTSQDQARPARSPWGHRRLAYHAYQGK